jgi:hypothetical protein
VGAFSDRPDGGGRAATAAMIVCERMRRLGDFKLRRWKAPRRKLVENRVVCAGTGIGGL